MTMRAILLYSLTFLFVCCVSNMTAQNQTNKTKTNYSSKAEKYAADGLTMSKKEGQASSKKKGQANSTKKKGVSDIQLPYNNTVPTKSGSAAVGDKCDTDRYISKRERSAKEIQLIETLRAQAASRIDNFIPCDGTNTIIIPVAIHYSNDFDCSNTQCLIDAALNNIATLNEDFAALNADIAYYNSLNTACPEGYPLDIVSDGTCMQFCLATQNHPAVEGIDDGEPAITIGQYTHSAVGGGGAPPWVGYANIFIDAGTGVLGVADAPGLANGDGVLVDATTFGGRGFAPCTSGTTLNDNATYNLGRTLTHEFGHYFDLYHTFQGGCSDGDTGTFSGQVGVITDTPATANPFFGCPTVTSCADAPASGCASLYAQITNYMDYTDDACMVMFSQDQAAVMNGWSNGLAFVDNATACGGGTPTGLAACQLAAAFNPPNNTDIVICTDDGTTIQFEDLSTNGPVSWDWTFTVTGGDVTLSSGASTMQNPAPMITGGTSGTIDVTLTVMDAAGTTETTTQTYTVTLVSGDACPNECDYTLELTDTFGDGWNGATLDVTSNGVPVAGSPFGNSFTTGVSEVNTITLTDGETISFNQTNGGFPGEEGFIITDPFGNVIFDASSGNVGSGEVFSFTAYCTAPTCDDGVQNGSETGIDCGGAVCDACPVCLDGFTELINETFDACVQPAGWTITTTGTASDGNGVFFNAAPTDVPGGGAGPSPDFSGCIALIDDDFADNVGITCIVSPVIDLTAYTNTSVTFDWQHEAFAGGGDFLVQVYDGTNFVTVFSADDDSNGTNETVALDAYANPNFQIQFCYDDEGGFQWGAGIDNIGLCGEEACAATAPAISTTSTTTICADDGIPDLIDVTVDDAGTGTPAWVITDENGTVLALPAAPPFDLEGAGAGTCLIWLANIDDPDFAIAPGDDAAAVIEAFCAELSNPIAVERAIGCGEVPTVGEWGLIILGLLMSIVAVVGIRERKIAIRQS